MKGRTLFVATEGANGVGRLRIPGWFNHHMVDRDDRCEALLLPNEISLDVSADVDWLVEQLKFHGPVELLVLDIFGGTMSGTEVEDTTARAWVRAVQRVVRETGAAVLTVAHTGWQDDTRARMHTHFWGSFDSRMRVEGDKDALTTCLTIERHKDADSSGSWGFSLTPSHGTLVPTLDEAVRPKKGSRWPASLQKAMLALDDAIAEHGEVKSGDGWPTGRVVPIERWREACERRSLSAGQTDARRMAFNRARDSLVAKKAIELLDDHVWGTFDEVR